MASNAQDLDKFLDKVNDIEMVMKGLTSDDPNKIADANEKADKLIEDLTGKQESKTHGKKFPAQDNTGVNRTVINQRAFDEMGETNDQTAGGPQFNQDMDQNAMLRAIEIDANERHERRKQRQKEATEFKDKGNEFFKAENYDKAIELYTQGLEKMKDFTALYTNRAQAYIKTNQFEKALEDCDWALRTDAKCIKAYIHQGRANLGLKKYEDALESYENALKLDPSKEKSISVYMKEVERVRLSDQQERAAQELFDGGDMACRSLVEILEKVHKDDQLPLYYSGGLRLVQQLVKDDKDRALFRTHNGLQLTQDHPVLKRCFSSTIISLSKDERELVTSTLALFDVAVKDNEENQKQLIEVPELSNQLNNFLQTKNKGGRAIRVASVNLLHQVSLSETGRTVILKHFNIESLYQGLFNVIQGVSGHQGAVTAASVLSNLAIENRFKSYFRNSITETVLPEMQKLTSTPNKQVIAPCLRVLTNFSVDPYIRKKLSTNSQCWTMCITLMEMHTQNTTENINSQILQANLDLIMNLSFEKLDQSTNTYTIKICPMCLTLLKSEHSDLELRSLNVLGRLLSFDRSAVECVCEQGLVEILVEFLKREDKTLHKAAVRCLAACTQKNDKANDTIVESKGLSPLVSLLKDPDEVVFGNASLVLSSMVNHVPRVSQRLTKTDVIKHLLVLARDGRKPEVQHNCGILIAKLAQSNAQHLERLRELHGMEILLDVMKHVKD